MDKEKLELLLLQTPDRIMYFENQLLSLLTKQILANNRKDEIETPIRSEVAMNKLLKNEGERKAALEIMLRDNSSYQNIVNELNELDPQIKKIRIELDFQRNMLRSYLAIADIISVKHR